MFTIEQAQDCADIQDAVQVVVTAIEQQIANGEAYMFIQLCEPAESNDGEGYITEIKGRFYEVCVGLRIQEIGTTTLYTIIACGKDNATHEVADLTTQCIRPVVMF